MRHRAPDGWEGVVPAAEGHAATPTLAASSFHPALKDCLVLTLACVFFSKIDTLGWRRSMTRSVGHCVIR